MEGKESRENKCALCKGTRVIFKGGQAMRCPECDRTNLSSYTSKEEVSNFNITEELDRLRAPLFVYEDDFNYDADKILRDRSIPALERKSVELESFINKLTELNERSRIGKMLPNSYLIVSDRGYSKTMFKWSLIKNLIKNGYKVSENLSTEDIVDMKVLDNKESILKYQSYFKNDVIILDLTGSIRKASLNISAMIEVLEKCGRMSKPLVCFSNFSLENIVSRTLPQNKRIYRNNVELGRYDLFEVNEYKSEDNSEEMSFKANR